MPSSKIENDAQNLCNIVKFGALFINVTIRIIQYLYTAKCVKYKYVQPHSYAN